MKFGKLKLDDRRWIDLAGQVAAQNGCRAIFGVLLHAAGQRIDSGRLAGLVLCLPADVCGNNACVTFAGKKAGGSGREKGNNNLNMAKPGL